MMFARSPSTGCTSEAVVVEDAAAGAGAPAVAGATEAGAAADVATGAGTLAKTVAEEGATAAGAEAGVPVAMTRAELVGADAVAEAAAEGVDFRDASTRLVDCIFIHQFQQRTAGTASTAINKSQPSDFMNGRPPLAEWRS